MIKYVIYLYQLVVITTYKFMPSGCYTSTKRAPLENKTNFFYFTENFAININLNLFKKNYNEFTHYSSFLSLTNKLLIFFEGISTYTS